MEVIDIILVIFFVFFIFKGYKNGFLLSISTLAGVVLGLYAIYHFNEIVVNWMQNDLHVKSGNIKLIASIATFVVVMIGVYFLSRFLSSVFKSVGLGFVNRLSGAALGLLKAVLIASFIFLLLAKVDVQDAIISAKTKEKSLLYRPVASFAPTILPAIKDYTKKTQEFIKK